MISGRTRVAAVIGDPIEHTRSPALHAAGFAALGIDAVMVPFRVSPAELPAAIDGMRALGLLGASVTLPHKQAVARLCDTLVAPADEIETVNCLCFEGGKVVGHNTDASGFIDALREAGIEPAGRRALLLGAGGASRAVAAGLQATGARVALVARAPQRARWSAEVAPFTAQALAAALPACDLLVDCTSAELTGAALPAPVRLELLPEGAAVASLLYGREIDLLARARARGLATIDGAGMLVHQGARACELWTGRKPPLSALWAAIKR